jgi:hypothetical protein
MEAVILRAALLTCHNERMKSVYVVVVALAVTLTVGTAAQNKKGTPQGLANLHFNVLKDDNGKPVRGASVVLHPVGKNGKQSLGGYQLKTDGEGKTESEGVPYGKLRVQVLAQGFQTFGEDYDINQPSMNIDIRLKRPQSQFTIYDRGGKDTRTDDGSPQQAVPTQQQPPK